MFKIKKLSKDNINSFIYSGYFFDSIYEHEDFIKKYEYNKNYNELSIEEIVEWGKKILLDVFSGMFETNKKHLIPMSGGLDCRLILSILLEFTEARNIETYTYGIPKSLDYEIGNKIASIAGTKHTSLDLSMQKYDLNQMINMSNNVYNQTFLFHHPPLEHIESISSQTQLWSGFFGGPAGGYNFNYNIDVSNPKKDFLKKNQFNNSIDFNTNEISRIINLIPDFEDFENITKYEKMDTSFRQRKFIAPHVLYKGPNYQLPFIEKKWLDFAFSINHKYRKNEFFYREIMIKNYPSLFKKGAKNFGGLSIQSSNLNIIRKKVQNRILAKLNKKTSLINNPLTNYIDFSREIITNDSLNHLVLESLIDFQRRDILEDNIIDKYEQHINRKKDYTEYLLIIASLEINIKALTKKGYRV